MNAQSSPPTDPAYAAHYAHHCRWCGTRLRNGACPVCGDPETPALPETSDQDTKEERHE